MKLAVVGMLFFFVVGHGFGYSFGKNKVQYRAKDWVVYESLHFNLHVEKVNEAVAAFALGVAEEAIVGLSKAYKHRLGEPVPIIVFGSDHEFLNNNIVHQMLSEGTRGFTTLSRNRVVLPFNGKFAEFRHVLVHEINHAFQFDLMEASDSGQFGLTQRGLWLVEGLAEYLTLGLDLEAEMYLRDGIVRGVLPSLGDLQNPYRLGRGYYYVYKGSQGFFYWVDQVYGREALHTFVHSALSHGTKKAFREVLGLKPKQASEDWHLFLRKRYWPAIADRDSTAPEGEQHTDHVGARAPFLRPVVDKEQKNLYLITEKRRSMRVVAYSMSRSRITKTIASAGGGSGLESLNALNNNLSMDAGRSLLHFTSRRGQRYVLNVYDLEERRLREYKLEGVQGLYYSSLSPSGDRVAFAAYRNGQVDLFVYDLGTGDLLQLTDDLHTELHPSWRPDGASIVYACNEDFGVSSDQNNLYDVDLATGGVVRLTSNLHNESFPQVSPDGGFLAFVSDKGGVRNVYVRDLRDQKTYQITDVIGGVGYPHWAADSKTIYYTEFHSGGTDVFSKELNLAGEGAGDGAVKPVLGYGDGATPPQVELVPEEPEANSFDYRPSLLVNSLYFLFGGGTAIDSGGGGFVGELGTSLGDLLDEYRVVVDSRVSYRHGVFDTDTRLATLNLKGKIYHGWELQVLQYSVLINITRLRGSVNLAKFIDNYAGYVDKQRRLDRLVRLPLNTYNRFDFGLSALLVERELLDINKAYLRGRVETFNKFAFPLSWSYTHDSTLLGFLHPIDNERSYVLSEWSPGIVGDDFLNYTRLFLDFRKYVFLTSQSSFAMRLMNGVVLGPDRRYFRFNVGGGGIHPNYPYIRGYPLRSKTGTTMHVLNLEYRTAFLEYVKFFFPIPLFLSRINGVVFYDVGTAYDDVDGFEPWRISDGRFEYVDLQASFGLGIRWLFFVFPLKIDFTMPHSGHDFGEWQAFFFISRDF